MLAVMLCSYGIVINLSNSDEVSSEKFSVSFKLAKAHNKYVNEFSGINCSLDAQWIFYADEQLREINNITYDMLDENIV